MYNKKCLSTYLFVLALICLFTLIAPFMNVNYIGEVSVALKILYYTTYVLYIICLVVIVVFGIYNPFKNTFTFSVIQEISAYIALFCLILNLVFFLPNLKAGLSVGYSILIVETFIMACFNVVLKLIRKMPTNFRALKNIFKTQKERFDKADDIVVNEEVKILNASNEEISFIDATDSVVDLENSNSNNTENAENSQTTISNNEENTANSHNLNTEDVEIEIISDEE